MIYVSAASMLWISAESQSGSQVDFFLLYVSTDKVFKYYKLNQQPIKRLQKNEDDEKKNYLNRIIFDETALFFVSKNGYFYRYTCAK